MTRLRRREFVVASSNRRRIHARDGNDQCCRHSKMVDSSLLSLMACSGASGICVGSDLSDSRSVYPVKAPSASSAALRPAVTGQPLPLEVVHAESGAFGQLGRMNLLLGRSQLDNNVVALVR